MIYFLPLIAWGVIVGVGSALKAAARPIGKRGATVVGTAATVGAIGLLWRHRGVVIDGAAVAVLAVAMVAVAGLLWLFPESRLTIIAAAAAGGTVAAIRWDHKRTGGRPWRVAINEKRLEWAVRSAIVEANPDAVPGRVLVRSGRVEAVVEHLGAVDHERVGQVLHSPHVTLVPGAEMGRSTVVVHDTAPSPELPVWEAIEARGALIWPGTVNTTGRVRFGEDAHGNVHTLPEVVNPDSAANVLVAGATGSGKSNGLTLMLCEHAWQPNVAWVGLDPHRVELKPFAPRMSRVAKGPVECYETLDWLVAEMDRRFQYLDDNDLGEWRIGVDGPGVLWIADELAALDPKRSWPQLARLTAEQRKIGFGCVAGTQRPEQKVIELRTRDNFQVRIAFGMNSREGTVMILDHDEDNVLRPTHIPEDLQGAYVLRLRRSRLAGRCYIPTSTGGLSKADVQDTARRVAAATAHLRVDLKGA